VAQSGTSVPGVGGDGIAGAVVVVVGTGGIGDSRSDGCDVGRDPLRQDGVARAQGPLRGSALGGLRLF